MSKKYPDAGRVIIDKPYFLVVDIGGNAQMTCPTRELDNMLRYGDAERMKLVAASAIDSFNYLVMECTKEEAWRRILLMRKAMKDQAIATHRAGENV